MGPMYVNSIVFNNSKILKYQKVAGKLLREKFKLPLSKVTSVLYHSVIALKKITSYLYNYFY